MVEALLREPREVVLEEVREPVFADLALEELEEHLALHIGDGAEGVVRVRVLDRRVHRRVGVIESVPSDRCIEFLEVQEVFQVVLLLSVHDLDHLILEEHGKSLIQPERVPVLAGDPVSAPAVGDLM